MVGGNDQDQRIAETLERVQRGDGDGRRGVAADRLEDRAAAVEVDCRDVGAHAVGMLFRGDQKDRRFACRPRRKPPQRLHQHRAVAGKIVELLRIVLARQRPQPRSDAAAHHETDDPICHVPPVRSKCLVVGADFGIAAQHFIDRLEHRPPPLGRHRAFDDDDELGLVGGRPHQAPGSVLGDHPHPVDRDQRGDLLAGELCPGLLHRVEVASTLSTTPYFRSSSQCGDMVGVPKVSGSSR